MDLAGGGGTVEVLHAGVTDDCVAKVDGVVEAESRPKARPESNGEKTDALVHRRCATKMLSPACEAVSLCLS